MDITDLATALRQLESGTTLPISTAQAQSDLSGDVADLIADYLGGALLLTDIGQPDVGATTVGYAGSLEFLGQTLPATATFWLTPGPAEGSPELTLALRLPPGWTFAATYPSLVDTDVGQLAFGSPAWVLESATSDGSGSYANLTQGLNFSGSLDAANSPSLAEVAWLLSAALSVTGALTNWSDPQTTAPTMTLQTIFGDAAITLGPVTLATQFVASVGYPPAGTPAFARAFDDGAAPITQVALRAQLELGSGPGALVLTLTMPVVADPPLLSLSLDASLPLDSLAELAAVAGGTALSNLIPAEYPLTSLLRLDEFTLVVAPSSRKLVSLSIGITLLPSQPALGAGSELAPRTPHSTRLVQRPSAALTRGRLSATDDPPQPVTWVIIPPNLLAISDVRVRFLINDPLHPSLGAMTAQIGGTFWLGDLYPISLQVLLPDVTIKAFLLPGYTIPIGDLLQYYGFDPPPGFELEVTELSMTANPSYRTFDLSVDITGHVTLISLNDGAISLTLTGISADLGLSQVGFSCQIIGYANFAGEVDFAVLARKDAGSAAGWTFGGSITHPFSVGELIGKVTGWTSVPGFLNSMNVTKFDVTYQTGTEQFSLDAGLSWLFTDVGIEIDLGFSIASTAATSPAVPGAAALPGALALPGSAALPGSLDGPDVLAVPGSPVLGGEAAQQQYSGSLSGEFTFLGMKLELVYAFDQAQHTDTYTLKFGELTVSYANPNAQGKRVLLINFGNVTLGAILSYLIKLADPGAGSSLSAPWSALDAINLSNLSVQVDFTDNFIEVDYALKLDLGFISIDNVGLRYYRDYGSGRVQIILQGDFLGQKYGQDNPLGWDAVGGKPPALPGAGSKLLELRYVGIGQHVTLDVRDLTTVKAVIDAMTKTVVPLSNTSKNPLDQVGGLRFDSGANWMFGASFTLLQTFSINAVFLDPVVYGVRIDVAGPEADIFQGLSFEILYRKISDTVGVYHIELKLPDAMRHLEFGEVSVTLPVVILDIYTNGNFRIDFGFPPNLQDWSQSFAVEVFPFVGYGGFYFALLDGSTSTRLPVIDNGRFAPDIEFGFALSVGVGKTISIGPLSAGVSVTVVGMIQGALAWFHPNDASTPKAIYYWIQGTIAIVGHVYGTVNFVVVKATLDLVVYASITLTVEAYQPIVIYLKAGVEVRISLTILFITLHFSFSATISLTFTIGSASTPPWHVSSGGSRDARMRSQLGLHRPAPALAQRGARQMLAPLIRARSVRAMAGRRQRATATTPITLWLTPVISQAEPTDFLPTASGSGPLVAANFLLFVENAIPPSATDARSVAQPVAGAENQPYNQLMGQLLDWAIQDLGGYRGTVTADDLAALHEQLDDPDQFAQWFSYTSVTGFFAEQQLVFQIEPRPTDSGTQASASFFPMFPELSLALGAGSAVSFWDTNPVDADYVVALDAYFAQLAVDYENSVENDPGGTGAESRPTRLLSTDDDSPSSMAGWLFGAYFGLLTKSVVQNAIDLLHAAPYQVEDTATTSLASIATSFASAPAEYVVRAGDSLESVEVMLRPFGARLTGTTLLARGTVVPPGTRLGVEVSVTPAAIVTANQSAQGLLGGGTPLSFAEVTYQVAPSPGAVGASFDQVAADFSFVATTPLTALAVMAANADRTGILLPGSSFALPVLTYDGRTGDTIDTVAAYFQVATSAVSQAGMTFTITGATHTVQGGFVVSYAWKDGDTLDTVIAAFFAPDPDDRGVFEAMLQRWNATLDFATIAPGTQIQLPLAETPNGLARYYFPTTAPADQLAALQPAISPALVLAPLAALTLAGISYPPAATDTLAGVAGRFNLTLDELAAQIGATTGILTEGATLSVPDVPAMAIAELVSAVQSSTAVNTAAASTSHFLLHGLRAPYPTTTQSPTYPLYSLTAQQLPLPSAGAAPAATLAIGAGQTAPSWITFAGGGTSLSLSFTTEEQQQITAFASLTLDPDLAFSGPLPLYSYSPTRSTVQNPLHWQAAALPPGCLGAGQSVVEPTVWSLPQSLLERTARAGGPALRYDLAAATYRDSTTGLVVSPVAAYTWGTAIPLTLQQLTGPDGAPLPDGFLLDGADDVGKQTLFELLAYLSGPGQTDPATVLLLYPPDPSGPNPKGLASDQLDAANTWLLKTNLSTLSHSGPTTQRTDPAALAARVEATPTYLATIDQSTEFLTLVWEASVVRSGGFYLAYANASHTGLPGYLFGQGPTADVTLLVLLGSQLGSTMTGLQPFNNVVVVGDNIDAGDSDVFAAPSVHTVLPGDTLTTIGTASPVALAQANQGVPGLLYPGRSLTLDDGNAYTILPGDTFAGIVAANPGSTIAGIATASASLDIFVPGTTVRFFGTCGHVVQAGDSLGVIASDLTPYNVSPAALGLANQTVLGLLQPGRTLSLDSSTSYTIAAGDTFASIYRDHPGSSIAGIASASADLAVFTPGALLQLAGRGVYVTGDSDTLTNAVSVIGLPDVGVAILGDANRDNLELLQPGTTLQISAQTSYQIQAGDTLASIARQFAPATPASIATASAGLAVLVAQTLVYYGTDQLSVQAAVPPGNTGFQLWRNASATTGDDQAQLDDLFSLVGFGIEEGSYFAASNEGLPSGPQRHPGALPPPGGEAPATDDPASYYQQVVSIYQSAQPAYNAVPATPALPAPAGNPYAGIAADPATASYSQVQLSLALHDLSGNLTDGSGLALDPIRVGYTDRLVGFSQWPSVSTAFDVVPGEPELSLGVAFRASAYVPGFGQSYRSSHDSARAHLARYTTLYYQLQEPGLLQFAVTSSIGQVDSAPATRQQIQLGMLGLVEQILLFLGAAQNLSPVCPPIAAGTPLATVAADFAVSVGDIVVANKDVELADRLIADQATLAIPTYFVCTAGQTVSGLLAQVTLTQLADPANLALPLESGTQLTVPAQQTSVAEGSTDALNQLAQLLGTTVADLAASNPTVLLDAAGTAMTFTLGGQQLPVGASDTLTSMANAFNQQDPSLGATATSVGVANETADGVFAGQSIVWTGYLVRPGDTLGGLAQRFGGGQLAGLLAANGSVPDLFPAGTAVYLSGQDLSYVVQAGDTFGTVAATHGVSLDALADRNTGLELIAVNQGSADCWLAIPDLVTFPADQLPSFAGYLARGGTETIADVIAIFPGWDATGFLALDADLPGLFAPTQLPGTSLTPALTDTVTSLATTLGVTPSAFLETFGGASGVLRAGATVLTPAAGTGAGTTISLAAATFQGVTPAALAEANAALQGVLGSQQLSFTYTPEQGAAVSHSYDSGPNDTFLTVTAAFNTLFGLTTLTVADVVAQNPQAALAADQPLLVPPAPAVLPPLTTTLLPSYPDPIFPLSLELQLLRDPNRVAPDLLGDTATFLDVTSVPPSPEADQSTASLVDFAERFEAAFAGLKLGTGEEAGAPTTTAKSRLWVVNFDPARGGVDYQVSAPDQGGFFAVRPLSTQPWTQAGLLMPSYTPGQPLAWTAHKNVTGANVDAWLANLLTSLDRVLSPQFALAAGRLGATAQSLLADLLTSKDTIADGLAGLVDHLLDSSTGDRAQAAEALRQQVLTSLSSLYDTTLLVQFPVTVSSPYTDPDTAPALSGKPVVKPDGSTGSGSATVVTHPLAAGDTFTSIGAQFGITVVDLVAANTGIGDVFAPDSAVAVVLGGTLTTVPVVAGDTLGGIAGKLFGVTDPTPVQVAEFAAALWACDVTGGAGGAAYVLYTDAPGQPTVLSFVELLPVVSFATGKVPLVHGSSSVTVLVGVRDPQQRRMAYFDLDFWLTQLEYDVRLPEPLAGTSVGSDYRESSWLSFVVPIDASALGQVQTPIPLRAYPGAPLLSAQTAIPSHPGDPDLDRAKEWNYAFTLDYQAAAQDSIEVGLFFNRLSDTPPVPPSGVAEAADDPTAIATALAQFNEVATPVEEDLQLLLADPTDSRVVPALQAFRDLVVGVATAWSAAQFAAASAPADDGEQHWYLLSPLVDEQQPDEFSYLALTAAEQDPLWPSIDGAPPALEVGSQALYPFQQPISAPLDLELSLAELDAIGYQNGWSGVSIIRNQNLLGSADPTDATNPRFVYRTPLSLFSSKITPALLIDATAPLTARTGADLPTALGDFFGDLFDLASTPPPTTFQIRVVGRYGYALSSGGTATEISPTVPLVLVPLYAFDTATDADPTSATSFVSRLAAAVTAAATGTGASTVPGSYLFDVGVYSSLQSAGVTLPSKPLLDIRNRTYPGAGGATAS